MKSKKLYLNIKRRNLTPLFILLFLSPYFVGFTSDSTYTYSEFLVGAGGGQYVYHDCSGVHTQNFTDAGIYIGKKFEGPYRLGLSAGGWSEEQSFAGVFPDLALDWKLFSIGTTGIRIGSRDDSYFETKWVDQPPFLSGRGFVRTGIGTKFIHSDTRLWFGTNLFPYNNLGLATQIEFPFDRKKFFYVNGRFGIDKTSGLKEYGISIGLRLVDF